MADASVIALDVGGTSVKSAVVALVGRIIGQPTVTPIDSSANAETILATFAGIIQHHLTLLNPVCLLGVAFGFPGPFDYETGVSYITGVAKYEAIYGLNIKTALQSRLGSPTLSIAFRNDAEAAIAGEARYGAGQPYRRLIGLTLGTGLGSAFIVDGVRVTSGEGIPPDGWLYAVPFRGVQADDTFSRRGLADRLQAAGITSLEVKDAATAARAGDRIVRQVFETFGRDLGNFLEPFAVSFQAEAVLILGGIALAFDLFGPALSQTLCVPALPGQCGPEAALLGAAEMLFIIK
jgi:glucokinase